MDATGKHQVTSLFPSFSATSSWKEPGNEANGRGKRVKWASEEISYHWNTFVSKLQRILNGS